MTVPYVLAPGETRWDMAAGDLRMGFLVRGADSDENLLVFHYEAPGGLAGPPRHVHDGIDEAFYVLEGTLRVAVGDDRHDLDAGALAWVPGGTSHGFANPTDSPTRFLGLAVPPGQLEAMFYAIAEHVADADGIPDPDTLNDINRRHGVQIVGPPVGTEG